VNPARLSSQLDFTVWSQDGEQIGEVEDMVLDLDNTRVAYVVVGTGGFLDLGERTILVPWDSLQLQTGKGDTTGGQQNAFILQGELDVFRNAPDFDLGANLPQAGQPAGDWDVDLHTYWESGGTTGGTANTPEGGATIDPNATAIATETAGGTGQATATTDAGQGAGSATATSGTDQGTDQNQTGGQALQGVVLASEVLDSTITLSPGQGQGEGQATTEPAPTMDPNATVDPNATATTEGGQGTGTGQEQGQGVGNTQGTIDDLIVAVDTGEIQYVVVDITLDEGQRWIPVPLSSIQWDAANGAFVINANPAMFREAPFFENGQYPDTTTAGWNSEFDTFWQNNGGGSGTGADGQATATP
jgi:sporulation protein YlmC with PRC-barrel domain